MSKIYTPKELSKISHKTLEDEGKKFSQCFTETKNQYFKDIKTKHLDDMISIHDFTNLFTTETDFSKVYQFVSQRETNKIMKSWTIAIGAMTVIILICTIANLLIALCTAL